jgi:hypothetical protein
MEFEKCKNILLQELTLVRQIASLQEQVRGAVLSRNWTDFDRHFNVLGEIGGEITALETGREALFDQCQTDQEQFDQGQMQFDFGQTDFGQTSRHPPVYGRDVHVRVEGQTDAKGRFYAFAANFPDEQRNELTEIYRTLKRETLKVQMDGQSLMSFITGARAAVAGFVEIAFPERHGKIYSPYGKAMSHDMRSMVVNRTF